jgi:hypothetical protein
MRLVPHSFASSLLRFAARSFPSFLVLKALSVASLAHTGSVYVPLDSWVYPAAERLALLTDVRAEVLGMRPWTRLQVAGFLKHNLEVELGVQSERVVMPLLTGGLAPKYNVSGWAGVTYWPEHKVQAQQ